LIVTLLDTQDISSMATKILQMKHELNIILTNYRLSRKKFLQDISYPSKQQILWNRFMLYTERFDPKHFEKWADDIEYPSTIGFVQIRYVCDSYPDISIFYVKADRTFYHVMEYEPIVEITDTFCESYNYILVRKLQTKHAAKLIQRNVRKWLGSPIYSNGRKGFVFRKAESSWNDNMYKFQGVQ